MKRVVGINVALFGLSLLFYFWGESERIWILLSSIGVSYGCVRFLQRGPGDVEIGAVSRRCVLVLGVVSNLGLLGWFKYYGFFSESLVGIFGDLDWGTAEIALPLGISFFVFQSLSSVVDAYRHPADEAPSLLRFATYISFFPQLVAGPIVRYSEIKDYLAVRCYGRENFVLGAKRFIGGLAKKVLIANQVALLADTIFAQPAEQLGLFDAWLGCAAYAIQVLYDFSGYSDMAIGLGLMFGIRLPENFNRPYAARSIGAFWRRWHMTLSRWFRDYLYIPLGGNRHGGFRTALNLFIVFALCGFWHGASWNFLLWGLLHGAFLSLERLAGRDRIERLGGFGFGVLGRFYVLGVVCVSWALFRAETVEQAWSFMVAMSGMSGVDVVHSYSLIGLSWDVLAAFAVGAAMALFRWKKPRALEGTAGELVSYGIYLVLFLMCISFVAADTYNPFIYFRF